MRNCSRSINFRPQAKNTFPTVPGTIKPGETCSICFDALTPQFEAIEVKFLSKENEVLDCGHAFHRECIASWSKVRSDCPLCRTHVKLEDEYPRLR